MEIIEQPFSTNLPNLRIQWVYWQGAFYILLVLLAYERWLPGGGDLTPENGVRGWIEVGLVAVTFLIALLTWGFKPFLSGFSFGPFVCLILFGALATASALWSPNFILSIGKAGGLVMIILLASAIAYQAARLDVPVARMILLALILMSVILFLINLFEFNSLLRMDWSDRRPRMVLAFDHPNGSSELFGSGLLASIFLLISTKFSRRWLAYLLGMAFMGICLLLTDSRAAILGTIFALCLIFISRLKTKYWIVIGLFLIVVSINVLFFMNLLGYLEPTITRFLASNKDLLTLNGRLPLWEEILNNSLMTKLVGVGYFGSRYMVLSDFSWGINSHNAYLEVFFTTGIAGTALLVGFYAACLSLLRNWRAYPLPVAVLAYASINSLTETKLFSPGVLMFVTCILIFHQLFLQQTARQAESQKVSRDK